MPKTKCLAVRCGAHHSLLFDPATHFSLHGNDQGAPVSCDELRDSETLAGYHLLKIILESARDFPGLLCAPIHLCARTCVHERGHACGCAGESLSHVTMQQAGAGSWMSAGRRGTKNVWGPAHLKGGHGFAIVKDV